MARGFGTTYGTHGTTDELRIAADDSFTLPDPCTVSIRFFHGSANNDRLVDYGNGGAPLISASSDVLYFTAHHWSGGAAFWTLGAATTGTWRGIAASYDGSDTGHVPSVYVDGSAATPTEVAAPSGSYAPVAGTLTLGNRPPGGRVIDGMLAEFAIWQGVLSDDVLQALSKGFSPSFWPNNRIVYVPLIRDTVDLHGTSIANSGTIVQPHCPTIMPAAMLTGALDDASSPIPNVGNKYLSTHPMHPLTGVA